ncbi:MAG: L,D-transpeptidase [Kofleriaceae bacterium]|nr:L,D-transpeptidase [Kofleriaceae bacterium]
MHTARVVKYVRLLALSTLLASCASDPTPVEEETPGGDLGLGDVSADDMKADGNWGAALTCKTVPNLPQLVNPKITLSIDGLTLHLTDDNGFDKVFPVGPGQIETDPTSGEFGESHSYYPIASTGRHDFVITPSTIQPCKTWWTDPETGTKSPVFAGLPFMSFYGNYAIHGPIDNYRATNGGSLRRGYVSHGCFRMEAADVLEVYARIKGVARVPVHVQREPERRVDGSRVDVQAPWIGTSCSTDSECSFTNGFCAKNAYSQRGFCSARCTSYCADKAGQPTTFCVADPNDATKGMCVPKVSSVNYECRPYDQFVSATVARFNQPAVTANVCKPGSRGWVGDHCLANADCGSGTSCRGAAAGKPGICSMDCDRFCADQPGYADTFCAAVPSLGSRGSCLRQCTPSSNASECPSDMACAAVSRQGESAVKKNVCVPR